MTRITPFYVIGSILSLGVDASCIAPVMPGPTMCGECGDVRGGSQCVSSGRWFSCYSSIAACCDSWDIKNQVSSATCVTASEEATANNAGSDVDSNEGIPQTDNDYCTKVVSLSEAQTNGDCMDQCDTLMKEGKKPEDDKDWSSKCVYSHWSAVNGRTVVEGDCFEKWIYGYSQEVNLASIDSNIIVDTPAQCQLHCQLNDDCVNWAWVSDLYASPGSEKVGRCLLKNKTMVEMALTISTSAYPSPNMNTQYCSYGLPYTCLHGGFRCLPCDGGDPKCVWESDMHISGWKYCTPTDTCSPFTALSTIAIPQTTTMSTSTTLTSTTTSPSTTTRLTTETTTTTTTTSTATKTPVPPTEVEPTTASTTTTTTSTTTLRTTTTPPTVQAPSTTTTTPVPATVLTTEEPGVGATSTLVELETTRDVADISTIPTVSDPRTDGTEEPPVEASTTDVELETTTEPTPAATTTTTASTTTPTTIETSTDVELEITTAETTPTTTSTPTSTTTTTTVLTTEEVAAGTSTSDIELETTTHPSTAETTTTLPRQPSVRPRTEW